MHAHSVRARLASHVADVAERPIRRELDRLRGEITRLMLADPECAHFDEREQLYVRFHELRARLDHGYAVAA